MLAIWGTWGLLLKLVTRSLLHLQEEGVNAYFGCKRGETKVCTSRRGSGCRGAESYLLACLIKVKISNNHFRYSTPHFPTFRIWSNSASVRYDLRRVWIRDVLNNSISFLEMKWYYEILWLAPCNCLFFIFILMVVIHNETLRVPVLSALEVAPWILGDRQHNYWNLRRVTLFG